MWHCQRTVVIIIPAESGGNEFGGVCLSVCLPVCLFVRLRKRLREKYSIDFHETLQDYTLLLGEEAIRF